MKMVKFEKLFVNSQRHTERRINSAQKLFDLATLEENLDCLEIGCGNGAVSKHFAEKYHSNVIGTDVDPEQIELAREGITDTPKTGFLLADATSLPFEDNAFDVVISFQVMHHIPNWLDGLKEIRRVLKPRGYIIFTDLIFSEWIANLSRLFKRRAGIPTMRDLDAFIQKNGFSTVYTSPKNQLLMQHDFSAVYQSN